MKYSIQIQRDALTAFNSNATLAVDAFNAVSKIKGAIEVEIASEDSDIVTVSYKWIGDADYDRTAEHLSKFGLRRVGW